MALTPRAQLAIPAALILFAGFLGVRGAAPARPEQTPRSPRPERTSVDPAARAEGEAVTGAETGGASAVAEPGPAARADSAPGAGAAGDTAATQPVPLSRAGSAESARLTYEREFFYYDGAGRRDPFKPLLQTDVIIEGPRFDELVVTGVFLGNGGGMVVVEDAARKGYFLKPGDSVGKATLLEIHPDEAVFEVREFGLSRRDTLALQRPEEAP